MRTGLQLLWSATDSLECGPFCDLEADGQHPNRMPFTGTLVLLDVVSDSSPHGAQGHRIRVPHKVVKNRLESLIGMGMNYQSDLAGHDPKRKIGIITAAWIEENRLRVKGFFWKKDFPEGVRLLRANRGRLGMSMELGDVLIRDKDEEVWHLEDFQFTGATVLLKENAAYRRTELAAQKSGPVALLNSNGGQQMKNQSKKVVNKGAGSGPADGKLAPVSAIAAAVESTLSTGIGTLVETIKASNQEFLNTFREGFQGLQKEVRRGNARLHASLEEMEFQKEVNAGAGAEEDDPEEIAAGEEEETEEPEEEEEMEAQEEEEEYEEDPDEEEEEEEMEAEEEPGDQNKDANRHAKTQSKSGAKGQLKASKKERPVFRISAAARKVIRDLRAENVRLSKKLKTQGNQLESMQAQIDTFTDSLDRKSLSPELSAMLEKAGYTVGELFGSRQKLSVSEVDQMFEKAGVPLDPTWRAAMKNQLMAAGVMDEGRMNRRLQ